jgi:mannose-1-phosphate guanylyltransferase
VEVKAILLAAGHGSRLGPLTACVPKCLVEIGRRPLLAIWLELLASHGVREVLVNTHHLAEKVARFSESWSGLPRIRLTYEKTLLGSAGTLAANSEYVAGEDCFLVCNADNLTDIDLTSLVGFHRDREALVTMTVFHAERPCECGIVEMDGTGLILGFEEKPEHPKGSVANGGIYVMSPEILQHVPNVAPADIAQHLLPRCLGRIYAFAWDGVLIDVGTPRGLDCGREAWAHWPAQQSRA